MVKRAGGQNRQGLGVGRIVKAGFFGRKAPISGRKAVQDLAGPNLVQGPGDRRTSLRD